MMLCHGDVLYRLSHGDPFTTAKTVLWQVCDG